MKSEVVGLCYICHTLFVSLGGLHHAAARISGDDVYRHLKYEGGTHRVQRIPEMGLSSRMQRIHTGTMSVIVLPQPEEVNELLIAVVRRCFLAHPFWHWSRSYLKPCYCYCFEILLITQGQVPASAAQVLWLWKAMVLGSVPYMFYTGHQKQLCRYLLLPEMVCKSVIVSMSIPAPALTRLTAMSTLILNYIMY